MLTQSNQYGRYIKLCSMRKGQPFLMLGPNKITFILCFILVNIASTVILILLNRYQQAYVFYLVHLVILIFLDLVWISAALSNPGIILKSTGQQYGCNYCKQDIQADQTLTIPQHCKKCAVCIQGRQYHCVIIGGCIGNGNKITYHFFLLGMVLYLIDFISTAPYIYYL